MPARIASGFGEIRGDGKQELGRIDAKDDGRYKAGSASGDLRRPVVGFELRRGNDNLQRLVARIALEFDPVQVQRQEAAEAGSGATSQQPEWDGDLENLSRLSEEAR